MGGWNPTKDREPAGGAGLQAILISKYEKNTWYKSPELVLKEECTATAQAPKAESKLTPLPLRLG